MLYQMPTDRPSFKTFFRVLWRDWGSFVSGASSIPFTVIALFADSKHGKVIWGALAVCGLLVMIYRIWSSERLQRITAEDDLASLKRRLEAPEMIIHSGAFVEGTKPINGRSVPIVMMSLKIENPNGPPSGITDWKVQVKFQDGRVVNGILSPPPIEDVAIPLPNGESARLRSVDELTNRVDVIPTGGSCVGWLGGLFPSLTSADIKQLRENQGKFFIYGRTIVGAKAIEAYGTFLTPGMRFYEPPIRS